MGVLHIPAAVPHGDGEGVSTQANSISRSGARLSLRQQMMLTTALTLPAVFLGYGNRAAYAACVNSGGTTYLCSGNETTAQTINANNAAVTMDAGATVDTSAGAGDAIAITGQGDLSFTNTAGGAISGAVRGVDIVATAGAAGSITINTTQQVTGVDRGIHAYSSATGGAININAAGVSSSGVEIGIAARTYNAASTGLSITATGAVTGGTLSHSIFASHAGTGDLTINTASVSSNLATGAYGIYAIQSAAGANASITATGAVSGRNGIRLNFSGTGAATVNVASVSSVAVPGIRINDGGNGTSTNITASGAVSGTDGINVLHSGSGLLSINAAAVTGNTQDGIYGRIQSAAGSAITLSGAVNGARDGIRLRSPGANQITVAAGASVTGATYGINTTVGAQASADTINLYGALNTNSILGGGNDRLTIAPTTTFGAGVNVDAGANTDTLMLAGTGNGTFDLNDIDTGGNTQRFRSFETLSVASGTWALSGTSALPFSQASGVLNGNPTLGGLTVNGGTVAPGNSIGTVTVNGNVVFNAGSIYQVEIDNTPASDQINATGTATLNGGTVQVTTLSPEQSFTNGTVFTILNAAGGVTGTFAGLTESSAFLDFALSYTPTQVLLTLIKAADFTSVTQTANQSAAATGLQQLSVSASADATAVFNALALQNAASARQAFDMASGEVHASALAAQRSAGELFNATMHRSVSQRGHGSGRMSGRAVGFSSDAPGAPVEQVAVGPNLAMWAAVMGETGAVDTNGNAGRLEHDARGLASGVDATWNNPFGTITAGLAAGYTKGDAKASARGSSADHDSVDIGVYAALDTGRLRLSTAGSYAFQDIDTSRDIAFGSINRTASANYDGGVFTQSVEAMYRIPVSAETVIAPLVSFDFSHARHDGFTETGAGALNLSGSSSSFTTAESGLGLALEHPFTLDNGGVVSLQAQAQWKHNFGDTAARQTVTLAGAPAAPFTVTGVERGRDTLAIGTGLGVRISDTISASVRYEGSFLGDANAHRAGLAVTVGF